MANSAINRSGVVSFHDASLSVWEEPSGPVQGSWELEFKRQVFARIVQQLNRIGWTCVVHPEMEKTYGRRFAVNYRYCRKGDLQAELHISGRCIELAIWQGVANLTRPGDGKYEHDKEAKMPYPLRLEMERTRRRIRDYLCNVFDGYTFKPPNQEMGCGGLPALEYLQQRARDSGHYNSKTGHAHGAEMAYNNRAADGSKIRHGARVWGFDRKGRPVVGTAFYGLNSMWWVITGRFVACCMSSFELYTTCPDNLRVKRNAQLRRKRLEQELTKATTAMNFERAITLREILFPKDQPISCLRHKERDAYHGPGYSGYTKDLSAAGRFTADEVRKYNGDQNEVIALKPAMLECTANG